MKINLKNEEKIKAALDAGQNGAHVRTVSYGMLSHTVKKIERRLGEVGLPKKLWKGMAFRIDPNAQIFPNAYKYKPISTVVVVERGSNDWFVTSIERDLCTEKEVFMKHDFSTEQKVAIVKSAEKKINF